MAASTKIEWADATWNPMSGCTKVSEGCRNCYAETIAERFKGTKQYPDGFGVTLFPDRLDQPLRWRKPRRVFVCSMGDLFHRDVPDEFLLRVFATMQKAGNYSANGAPPGHIFMVLTKRPERMRSFCQRLRFRGEGEGTWWLADSEGDRDGWRPMGGHGCTPLRHVWLGVSVEDQETADERIPHLLDTPAALRFVSYEPALGPLDLGFGRRIKLHRPVRGDWPIGHHLGASRPYYLAESNPQGALSVASDRGPMLGVKPGEFERLPDLDWVIAGGESGPGSRPAHPDWFREVRDQCAPAGVPFFFKQWGDWAPEPDHPKLGRHPKNIRTLGELNDGPDVFDNTLVNMVRVGKKAAGHELDGQVHQEWPEAQP